MTNVFMTPNKIEFTDKAKEEILIFAANVGSINESALAATGFVLNWALGRSVKNNHDLKNWDFGPGLILGTYPLEQVPTFARIFIENHIVGVKLPADMASKLNSAKIDIEADDRGFTNFIVISN